MHSELLFPSRCLTHQLVEDQASMVGLVCRLCKEHLDALPPRGRPLRFWESQPAAFSAAGEPCFVYTILWEDYRIRSLHPPHADDAARRQEAYADLLELAREWLINDRRPRARAGRSAQE
jgi:hypothetical protein